MKQMCSSVRNFVGFRQGVPELLASEVGVPRREVRRRRGLGKQLARRLAAAGGDAGGRVDAYRRRGRGVLDVVALMSTRPGYMRRNDRGKHMK